MLTIIIISYYWRIYKLYFQPTFDQNNNGYPNQFYPMNLPQQNQVTQYVDPRQSLANSNQGIMPNFSGLIGTNVTLKAASNPLETVITDAPSPKKRGRKKKKDEQTDETNSKNIVENTVYADSYIDTNNMAYNIINQTDILLDECKQELEFIRSQRNLKGKYHYINDTVSSMGTLLNTKLNAIKEINSTIKTVNDNEYRRFKDMRAFNSTNDNKAVMDAYSAFISAPVGAPKYQLPGTVNITGGLNGVIQAGYPKDIQDNMNAGMQNYLSHLTPEENLMLNDNNANIEEVIVYDQATGAKYFQWVDTRTNTPIPNMPVSSELTIEDFVIDPRTKLAKNSNLNTIKKVIVLNEGAFDRF